MNERRIMNYDTRLERVVHFPQRYCTIRKTYIVGDLMCFKGACAMRLSIEYVVVFFCFKYIQLYNKIHPKQYNKT